MRILHAATEAVPFCKTGGLGDVVGALAQRLGNEGNDVCLFLPKYRDIDATGIVGGMAQPVTVAVGREQVQVSLRYMQWKAVSVYFVDHPESFDREGLYSTNGKDFPDNERRFIIFSRAVLEGVKSLGFKPDIIHLHDWQTALIAAYVKRVYHEDPHLGAARTVLTVHNLAYQGLFPPETFALAGFADSDFSSGRMEFAGKFGFLKAGLVHADLVTTVSPAYAREIRESEKGFGLEGVLRSRGADLQGVLNGVDYEAWNPQTDRHLAKKYSLASVEQGKAACKADLQAACGFEARPDIPLIGIVSRLVRQKGLDVGLRALQGRLGRVQVAVLGLGEAEVSGMLAAFAREHPGSVFFRQDFDEPMVHKIYGGADLFLMPSRFEPCGLSQMIAMRYGTLPVVSRTGGLTDTVIEAAPEDASGAAVPNGFVAEPEDAEDLGRAIDRALAVYAAKADWRSRVAAAMERDFSWDRSTSIYLDLYRRLRRLVRT
ncbi:MAG: glycogen synthase GlgA [Elusimicrobia bacterium]|nr:glycogen synthase GlgA [Elusimicrobiota bacterium]